MYTRYVVKFADINIRTCSQFVKATEKWIVRQAAAQPREQQQRRESKVQRTQITASNETNI